MQIYVHQKSMDNIGFVLMPLILHNLETNLTLLGFVAYENITLVVIPVFSYNVKLKFYLIFFFGAFLVCGRWLFYNRRLTIHKWSRKIKYNSKSSKPLWTIYDDNILTKSPNNPKIARIFWWEMLPIEYVIT